MKLAVMQPYLFPYLGYFQLIAACDAFVLLDDVQYINRGWITRNRVCLNGADHMFTLSVANAPLSARINERVFSPQLPTEVNKLRRLLEHAYRKAPHFAAVAELFDETFSTDENDVARVTARSVQLVCRYLGIERRWFVSSQLQKNEELHGQERILEINRVLGATEYFNPIGGTELYDRKAFEAAGIPLHFVKSRPTSYSQFGAPFVPNLSILDVLMFNSVSETQALLYEYDLL
jgi:hypothetical protein